MQTRILSRLFLTCSAFIFTLFAFGQTVSGVQASIVNDQIEIQYRISNVKPGQKYRVRLFSSIDDFQNPITDGVTGAIGEDIGLTTTNTMTIADPITTLGPITGDVNFRVRADLTYYPVTITSHSGFFSAKRGKTFTLKWDGGLTTDNMSIDLYRNLNLVQEDVYTSLNNGVAEFKMPKKLELGEGYHMRLNFPSLDSHVETSDFLIKRKKSIGGRVATWAILLGGGAAAYIVLNQPTTEDGLPDPPSIEELPDFSIFNN